MKYHKAVNIMKIHKALPSIFAPDYSKISRTMLLVRLQPEVCSQLSWLVVGDLVQADEFLMAW